MNERGELVTTQAPLEALRRALAGAYQASAHGREAVELRDDLEKLVCRVTVMSVPGGSNWLTVTALRGYEQDADRIRRLLRKHGFQSEDQWKSATVTMSGGERSDAVVARVLLRLQEIQDANLPGALAGTHVEFLHDFRVAIRRTRSVLREMRGVFIAEDLQEVRADFKWLQDQTSAARDLDVYLEDLEQLRSLAPEPMRADLAPLQPLLEERRRRARLAMSAALTGERARTLHGEWRGILHGLILEPENLRPDASRPIAELAGGRIRRVHDQMVRMGSAIDQGSAPEAYHELRKKGKELRYLLELFGAHLFDPELVKPLVSTLKLLQDVLGLHQDREVQAQMLRELAQELIGLAGGAQALMAIGTLVDRLEADSLAARGRFSSSFAQFSSAEQRRLVTDGFR